MLLSILDPQLNAIFSQISSFILGLLCLLLISSLFRFLFGKKAQIGKAITSAMEVICLYLIFILARFFLPGCTFFEKGLPFLSVEQDQIVLFSLMSGNFSHLMSQIVRLLLICFLLNLLNSLIPEGKKFRVWFPLRVITVILALWLNYTLETYLALYFPNGLEAYSIPIIIGVMFLLLAMGSLRFIVGLTIGFFEPLIGALYTFFFSNFFGRALARTLVSTGLLMALLWFMNAQQVTVISIGTLSLLPLIPIVVIVILLWYWLDRII